MIEVVYFDLGGVLFTDFFSGAERELAQMLGLSPKQVVDAYRRTDAVPYSTGHMTDEERWSRFLDELGLPHVQLQSCIDAFYRSYQAMPDSVALLQSLAAEHRHRLGVLSDQPTGVAAYLRQAFPEVFACFEPNLVLISAEVGLSKRADDTELYDLAVWHAGVEAERILFVDNSQHNVQAFAADGLRTYFFDIADEAPTELVASLRERLA